MDASEDIRNLGDFARVDATDTSNLVARLDAMSHLDAFQAYKRETFELLRIPRGGSVADVGCGTGEDARRLAEMVGPSGKVVGYDLSEAMLEEAGRRHREVQGLTFSAACTQGLPAKDGTFDAIRADRVLIHVPDPSQAVAEMKRVVAPGGRIVVSEPDMPGCWVSHSDVTTTAKVMDQISRSCVKPYLARDLWGAFLDAGLRDVRLAVWPVTVFDTASVGTILDFGSVLRGMLSRRLLTEEVVATWMSEFEERGRAGRFMAGVNIFVVSGTRP